MPVLAVSSKGDELIGLVAAFALATRVGTALIVDLVPDGRPAFPGRRTLAQLVDESPTLDELVPRRQGVAALPNGGVDVEQSASVVEALRRTWPAVVARAAGPVAEFPHAPVRVSLPNARATRPAIWVRTGLADPGGEGPRVDGPRRSHIQRVLSGHRLSGRWLRSWDSAWEWPWE